MFRLMFSRRWWFTSLLVLVGILVTVRLGIWQLDRLSGRRITTAHIQLMQAAAELVLSDATPSQDLPGMEFRAIVATGVFDFKYQVAVRNQVWTQSWGDDIGYVLVAPLVFERGQAVLVNRGWIPARDATPELWKKYDEPGMVTVKGIIRLPLESPDMGGGVSDPTLAPGQTNLQFWNFINIQRLQVQMPYTLLSIYIQRSPDSNNSSMPYRSLPEVDLTEGPHLGYALQWFFYACLFMFGYPVYLRKYQNAIPHH